ncbi:MAG TPA: hypothetical protein VN363_02315, partial [Anaerolineales bacterium]|nr:hypothetical protein [Anaerolineales bacterium]
MSSKRVRLPRWLIPVQRRFQHFIQIRWLDISLLAKMSSLVITGLLGLMTIFALLGISTASQTTRQAMSDRVMLARMTATSLDTGMRNYHTALTLLASQPAIFDPTLPASEKVLALANLVGFDQGLY